MGTQAVGWRRLAKAVLYINTALNLLIAIPGYLLHVGPAGVVPAMEPIVSREYGALHFGYIAMCIMVLVLFEKDRRWLLVPPLFLVPIWIATLNEVIAYHLTADIPPSVIRPILIAGYLVAYAKLAPAHRGAASDLPGAGSPQPTR